MNEKKLLETWQAIAVQHKLELKVEDQTLIKGVITEYLLHIRPNTLLKARISKKGSYHQQSCKLIISALRHGLNPNYALDNLLRS